MKRTIRMLAVALLLAAPWVQAASPLTVEGVQAPAWVERDGKRQPLVPGMTLANGDQVVTGGDARALLRLADGSTIKLGENGRLALADLGSKPGSTAKTLVTASLDVLAGAFRFTTTALYKFRGERDVKVKIVTVTAGIRGTDVWGKAAADRDIVCLIEGKIAVTRGTDSFSMDEPLSFFIAPRNAPPLPVARVSTEQLTQWAKETDIAPGAGMFRKGGQWSVIAVTHPNQPLALQAQQELQGLGFASSIRSTKTETSETYVVRVGQIANQKDAAAVAARLKSLGFVEAKAAR
ncbi:MAG: FecR domain-containing protein [Burkholderiales bacterium]